MSIITCLALVALLLLTLKHFMDLKTLRDLTFEETSPVFSSFSYPRTVQLYSVCYGGDSAGNVDFVTKKKEINKIKLSDRKESTSFAKNCPPFS